MNARLLLWFYLVLAVGLLAIGIYTGLYFFSRTATTYYPAQVGLAQQMVALGCPFSSPTVQLQYRDFVTGWELVDQTHYSPTGTFWHSLWWPALQIELALR